MTETHFTRVPCARCPSSELLRDAWDGACGGGSQHRLDILDFDAAEGFLATPSYEPGGVDATVVSPVDPAQGQVSHTCWGPCQEYEARLAANTRYISQLQMERDEATSQRDRQRTVAELRRRALTERARDLADAVAGIRQAVRLLQQTGRSTPAIRALELLVIRLS